MENLLKLLDDKIIEVENCDDIEITEEYLKGYINGLNMARDIIEEEWKLWVG